MLPLSMQASKPVRFDRRRRDAISKPGRPGYRWRSTRFGDRPVDVMLHILRDLVRALRQSSFAIVPMNELGRIATFRRTIINKNDVFFESPAKKLGRQNGLDSIDCLTGKDFASKPYLRDLRELRGEFVSD